VTILATYFDDSREDRDDKKILVVAGYMADLEYWDQSFGPAWRAFRDDPTWPNQIKEYKACDCRWGYGDFEKWPQRERTLCTRRAVEIIRSSFPVGELVGFAAAVEMPQTWTDERRDRFLPFAYRVCAGLVVHMVLWVGENLFNEPSNNTVSIIFDEEKKLRGKVLEDFYDALEYYVDRHYEIDRPDFKCSKKVLPLQAADLLAFETYKDIQNRRDQPKRPASRALRALLDAHYHRAVWVDAANSQRMVEIIESGRMPDAEEANYNTLYESGMPLRTIQ
jgi:hypothetical protein